MTAGVTVAAEVSTIHTGVRLSFEDITRTAVHKWRSNTWLDQTVNLTHAANGGVYMCNHPGTAGEASGCDPRAACVNEPLGGVRCRCTCSLCVGTCTFVHAHAHTADALFHSETSLEVRWMAASAS